MKGSQTETLFEKTSAEMRMEAKKLREEFEEYIEDLELFSDPKFWATVKQVEEGKTRQYKDINEFGKRMGLYCLWFCAFFLAGPLSQAKRQ